MGAMSLQKRTRRWYDPLLSAVRIATPIVVVLFLVDGHSLREFVSLHFLRLLVLSIAAGSVVVYAAVAVADWRRPRGS
jgi:hypothetical protein